METMSGAELGGTNSRVDSLAPEKVDRRFQECLMSINIFHPTFHVPRSTEHLGTARNATGHYVVDVVEFPEWCWGLGEYCQG
jgi:hypothetical protein